MDKNAINNLYSTELTIIFFMITIAIRVELIIIIIIIITIVKNNSSIGVWSVKV